MTEKLLHMNLFIIIKTSSLPAVIKHSSTSNQHQSQTQINVNLSLKLESAQTHRLRWGQNRQHTHPGVPHLVGRRLSTSCASSRRSASELRQPPPAQDQQVNQRSQPHQHRHGHRQPPAETLHFPVRWSRRRRPQPSRRLVRRTLPREARGSQRTSASCGGVGKPPSAARAASLSVGPRSSHAHTPTRAVCRSSASWARLTATSWPWNQSAWVPDPPEGLKGGAPPADTRK